MDKAEATKGLRQAKSFFDFINVELYTNRDRYSVKLGMEYFIWSELNNELQSYVVNEALQWINLQEYVDAGLVYIEKKY